MEDSPLFGYIGIVFTFTLMVYFYLPVVFWIVAGLIALCLLGIMLGKISTLATKNGRHND